MLISEIKEGKFRSEDVLGSQRGAQFTPNYAGEATPSGAVPTQARIS